MVVLKLLLVLTIIGCSTMLGIKKSKKYVIRERVLREAITFFKKLETEIKYMMTTLPNAIESARINLNSSLKDVLGVIGTDMLDGKHEFDLVFSNMDTITEILPYDKQLITNGIVSLGSSDVNSQINIIENTVDMLNSQYTEAKDDRQKNFKLYRTVGLVTGIVIAILFV